ncbi:MAG: radical SAM protein [Hyphomicrobiaceae bacterium]
MQPDPSAPLFPLPLGPEISDGWALREAVPAGAVELVAKAHVHYEAGRLIDAARVYSEAVGAGSAVAAYWLAILALDHATVVDERHDPLAMLGAAARAGIDLATIRLGVEYVRSGAAEGGEALLEAAASRSRQLVLDSVIGRAHAGFERGDMAEALALYRAAARIGSPVAGYWIGLLVLDHGVPAEPGEARLALRRAADAGHVGAATRLARHLLATASGATARAEAVQLLKAAAAADDPGALMLLAQTLGWGVGAEVDHREAEKLLVRAGELQVDGSAAALEALRMSGLETRPGTAQWMSFGPESGPPPAPAAMTIEITTRCNLACVMCPHGLAHGGFIKRDAPEAMVEFALSSLDRVEEIHPTGVGEPLLAPGFWRLVDALAGRQSPRLTFHTNGILLTERNVARLMRAPIGAVNVSVDAAEPLTYLRIRGAEMVKTTRGISRLVAALEKLGGKAVERIAMSMVLMRENVAEAAAFVRLASELGVRRVYFEHLTEPQMPAESWIVERNNFTFQYAEQKLFASPELADGHVLEAFDEADRLGIVIEGYQVLLLTGNAHHETRSCRTGAALGRSRGS